MHIHTHIAYRTQSRTFYTHTYMWQYVDHTENTLYVQYHVERTVDIRSVNASNAYTNERGWGGTTAEQIKKTELKLTRKNTFLLCIFKFQIEHNTIIANASEWFGGETGESPSSNRWKKNAIQKYDKTK